MTTSLAPPPARVRELLDEVLSGQATALAAVVATVATLGSLYLSEVAHFQPCSLRWVEHFGFVTIPVMALAAFLLVATLLWVRSERAREGFPLG